MCGCCVLCYAVVIQSAELRDRLQVLLANRVISQVTFSDYSLESLVTLLAMFVDRASDKFYPEPTRMLIQSNVLVLIARKTSQYGASNARVAVRVLKRAAAFA